MNFHLEKQRSTTGLTLLVLPLIGDTVTHKADWKTFQEARVRFSEVFRTERSEGPQFNQEAWIESIMAITIRAVSQSWDFVANAEVTADFFSKSPPAGAPEIESNLSSLLTATTSSHQAAS